MKEVSDFIVDWLNSYSQKSNTKGFVIGISGGVDSALTSVLCALTGRKVILVNMPILQTSAEYQRAQKHIENLKSRFENVSSFEIDLTAVFQSFSDKMPFETADALLAMANSRARIRMTTLYAIAQVHGCLVAGTGNKIEDFGIGFYTKYGDGGVDLSPIADLTKTQVFKIAKAVYVIEDILIAKPTDGLWPDGRSDEDQIGATYPELEWAMEFKGEEGMLTEREKEVLKIYRSYHQANKHKMEPIPVCELPQVLKENLLTL